MVRKSAMLALLERDRRIPDLKILEVAALKFKGRRL